VNPNLENELDPATCWQAMSVRDRRFDGRFFAAVVTTKVYCRPICPIPLRKPENVTWFSTASAAEARGFRPCRRCRPHTSPGTPAWHGTSAVVARALRLIEAGAMDHGNVEELAEHVGIGARHLRRLFVEHLGIAPNQIANARRLRMARQLLKETSLSINQVAASAGFQSIRQFNHAIRSSFEQSPSKLRKAESRIDPAYTGEEISLYLPFHPPMDWSALLRFFSEHAIPGIETVDDHCYRRTIQLGDAKGFIEVACDPNRPRLQLRIKLSTLDSLILVAQRARTLFDLDADPKQMSRQLVRTRRPHSIFGARPGLRVPGAWDVFETVVLAVLGQRLGTRAGASAARLVRAFGRPIETSRPGLTHLFPLPETLAQGDLASIGINSETAEKIHMLATGYRDGKALTRILPQLRLDEDISRYLALRTLGEQNSFAVSDGRSAYAAMYQWIAHTEGITSGLTQPG
jgi:AraC family transcriptional regulator, regulatory protein of adaptative response / DNA-3-methyladenine glycosylase II